MADTESQSAEEIKLIQKRVIMDGESEGEEEELEDEEEEDWNDWGEDGDEELDSNFVCLFCDSNYTSCNELFEHCRLAHKFDFQGIRKRLGLDFYGSFKLINYVRSQVAQNGCWSCGVTCQSKEELQNHLHETANLENVRLLWDDDKYLKPFMQDDMLLHSFSEEEEEDDEDDYKASFDKDELMRHLGDIGVLNINEVKTSEHHSESFKQNGTKEPASSSNGQVVYKSLQPLITNGVSGDTEPTNIVNLSANKIKTVNDNYFGSYSSFGIHREMISDKVRTDSYRQALMKNPSLLTGAVVMDVGCGTGILSLFAAQAGATRVIAVEASEKMAAVATQIAKDNNLLRTTVQSDGNNSKSTGVMEVVKSMVEELDKSIKIEPHSLDVLVSEWMGYCLLYESMLGSVLFARDKWLKPGGAILPDTAIMYAAGFGRSCTSLPFWEDVYGFNMSCVGNELVQDAARIPIVDVVQDSDLVTHASVLQKFDLATMSPDDVDFTATIELEPKSDNAVANLTESKAALCYGIVVWFDTGFTSRFCKEMPALLSTSPYTPKTHWCQTLLTLRDPIAIASMGQQPGDNSAVVGSEKCPVTRLSLRISIARGVEHRSIDISMEASGVDAGGRKRAWPAQIFHLS
ncbi:unnamed protein product [Linum trigynum]|uniref:type I protein arginine methyltransferase n=1 Tax=Linum trigynum TaxID=586398 RepID=A0AAV2DUS1_9ROSI